jgi:hypothetical protein
VLADSLNLNGFRNAEESFEKVESSARGSPRSLNRGWFSSSDDNVGSQAVVEAPTTVAIVSVFAALTEADRNGMGQIHCGNRLRAWACMERTKGAL